MAEEQFRLIFRGELLAGSTEAEVCQRLAALLGLEAKRARALFRGGPVVIKRAVDRATAARYQARFKTAGARLRVAVEESSGAEAESAHDEVTPAQREAAAAGAEPVKPPRRHGTTLAERLAQSASPQPESSADPDRADARVSSHADDTVAAPGDKDVTKALSPDTGRQPHSRTDADAQAAATFTLAPVGSDVLNEHERARPRPITVDTSHLTASEPGDEGLAPPQPAPPRPPDTSALALIEVSEEPPTSA